MYRSRTDAAGFVTTARQLFLNNTVKFGVPTFSFANNTLAITNANFTGTVNAVIDVTQLSARQDYPMR